ncbi:MAG: hypothetical protein MHM6MM_002327 [Cercozoa sp. M6MM]
MNLVWSALLASLASSAVAFDACEQAEGVWDVSQRVYTKGTWQESEVSYRANLTAIDEGVSGPLSVLDVDGTVLEEREIALHCDDLLTGSLLDEDKKVLSFDLAANVTKAIAAAGAGVTENDSKYSVSVFGKDSFALTLQEEDRVVVFAGERYKPPVEKSFFQKYGQWIMIAGVMGLQMFLRSKMPQPGQQAQAQAAAPAAAAADADAAAAAATPARKSKKAKKAD